MELSKEKDHYILKPNIKNAMIPKVVGSATTALFFTLILSMFLISMVDSKTISKTSAILISIVIFVLLVAIPIFLRYMSLINTEYRFFRDKLEYYEGWLTINRHTIPYEKVTDVVMRKSLWDRLFNTATIGIITAGTYTGSVFLPYLNEPENTYHTLQRLIIKKSN